MLCRHGLAAALNVRASRLACTSPLADVGWRRYSSDGEQNVAVLGGGITGLATAYYLSKELPRANITVYEASDRIGGWLSSKRVPVKDGTVLFEAGPRALRPSSNGVLAARLVRRGSRRWTDNRQWLTVADARA